MQKYLVDKTALIHAWEENGVASRKVLSAFKQVPREDFISSELRSHAYEDSALPLLRGKTISQPTTVVFMTEQLEVEPGNVVLEIGSGSGYQSAILSKLVGRRGKVITCEIVPELAELARKNLARQGITNVIVLELDGSQGVPGFKGFDRIITTCAASEFPKPLVKLLKEDGIILGPIGTIKEQELVKAVKIDGKLMFNFLGQFIFTPMLGKYGFL